MPKTSNGQKTTHELYSFIGESILLSKDDEISLQEFGDMSIEGANLFLLYELKHSSTSVSGTDVARGISQLFQDYKNLNKTKVIPILRIGPQATFLRKKIEVGHILDAKKTFEKINALSKSNKKVFPISSIEFDMFVEMVRKLIFYIDHYAKDKNGFLIEKERIKKIISKKYSVSGYTSEIIFDKLYHRLNIETKIKLSGGNIRSKCEITIFFEELLNFVKFKNWNPDSNLSKLEFELEMENIRLNTIEDEKVEVNGEVEEYLKENMEVLNHEK